MKITTADLSRFTFQSYRKTGLTKISNEIMEPGTRIVTTEGIMDATGCRLAVDAAGNPYPIEEKIFQHTYAQADQASNQLIEQLRARNQDPAQATLYGLPLQSYSVEALAWWVMDLQRRLAIAEDRELRTATRAMNSLAANAWTPPSAISTAGPLSGEGAKKDYDPTGMYQSQEPPLGTVTLVDAGTVVFSGPITSEMLEALKQPMDPPPLWSTWLELAPDIRRWITARRPDGGNLLMRLGVKRYREMRLGDRFALEFENLLSGSPDFDRLFPPAENAAMVFDGESLAAAMVVGVWKNNELEWTIDKLLEGVTQGATVIGPGGTEFVLTRAPAEIPNGNGFVLYGVPKDPHVTLRDSKFGPDPELPWVPCSERVPEPKEDWNHSEWCLVYYHTPIPSERYYLAYYNHKPPFGEPPRWMAPGKGLPASELLTHWCPLSPAIKE